MRKGEKVGFDRVGREVDVILWTHKADIDLGTLRFQLRVRVQPPDSGV